MNLSGRPRDGRLHRRILLAAALPRDTIADAGGRCQWRRRWMQTNKVISINLAPRLHGDYRRVAPVSEIPIQRDAQLPVELLIMPRADGHDVGQRQTLVLFVLNCGAKDEID
jgi:hypothetical protein